MKKDGSESGGVSWGVLFLLLAFFHHLVASQPQVYFKASLPAKSLPRIGRRSGSSDGLSSFPSRSASSSLSPASSSDVFGGGAGSWDPLADVLYNSLNGNSNSNYNAHPDALLLLRRFLAEREREQSSFYPQDANSLQPLSASGASFYKYPGQEKK